LPIVIQRNLPLQGAELRHFIVPDLITKTDALTGALDGLPLSEWSEDDRNDLVNALTGVRSKIEELLNTLSPQPVQEEPVNPGGPGTNLA
jgi:hypothetical protein